MGFQRTSNWGWRVILLLALVISMLPVVVAIRLDRPARSWTIWGRAMGGEYHVTVIDPPAGLRRSQAERAAAGALERVESLMSTYRADSEVVRFGAARSTDWQAVSPETARVVAMALEIGRQSGGLFDITVAPLVDLWGFGPVARPQARPDAAAIAEARKHIGPHLVEVRLDPPALRKTDPEVRIDLSGIAKGFGVDQAAEALESLGVTRYCVEVGGEIRARGLNAHGRPWQVAIEAPITERREVERVVPLEDQAMATSGDYRNYVEVDGIRYCHIIDPRTGEPISHKLASASVWNRSCARADAWATALLVAGPEAGEDLARRHDLRAFFIARQGEGFVTKWVEK